MTERDESIRDEWMDDAILDRIHRLTAEALYAKNSFAEEDRDRLGKIRIQMDLCWDLLRHRRARRDAVRDLDEAEVRRPDVVARDKV